MMTSDREREDAAARLRAGMLPPLRETFDQLWSKEALGSRVRLRTTATFLTQFAAQVHATSGAALLELLLQVRQLLTSDWSYQAALLNGTAWLLAISFPAQEEPDIALVRKVLAQRCSRLLESNDQAIQRIVTFLANVLGGADAVLADGELINTTGTLPLSITAHHFRIPVYCPAELMKLSIPSVYGQLLPALPVENSQETYTPLFDITPAECLHAYVTEIGLIPPVVFSAAARQNALVTELL